MDIGFDKHKNYQNFDLDHKILLKLGILVYLLYSYKLGLRIWDILASISNLALDLIDWLWKSQKIKTLTRNL